MNLLIEKKYSFLFSVIVGLGFILPIIAIKATTLILILLFVLSIHGLILKYVTFEFSWPIFTLFLVYCAYLIGGLFTQHPEEALRYIIIRIPMLVLPFIFMIHKKESELNIKLVNFFIVIGNFIALFLCFKHSFVLYKSGLPAIQAFQSSNFSYLIHPTYYSAINICSLLWVYIFWQKNAQSVNFKLVWIFALLSFAIQIFCASIAGILFLGMLILFFIGRYLFRKLGKIQASFAILLAFFLVILAFFKIPAISQEGNQTVNAVKVFIKNPSKYVASKPDYKTGNEIRLILWTCTVQEIVQNPFGVGTGNVDDHLQERLYQSNQKNMVEKLFNPHNQFLQTALELGVFGLFMLLWCLFSIAHFAYKEKNLILLLSVCCMFFNALFESVWQTQAGIYFFTYFFCLLIHYSNGKKHISFVSSR